MYVLSDTLQAAVSAGNPQRVLIEFFRKPDDEGTPYDPPVQFSNEDILVEEGLRLTSEFNSETDLTVGLCPSAEIQFSMLNDRGQLEDFEFGTFRAYLGAKITSGIPAQDAKTKTFPDGLYEFAPLGVFIAHRPDIVRKKTIEVDANDQMTLFDRELPDIVINWPQSLYYLTNILCGQVGVSLKSNTWLNSDLTVRKQPEQFEGATMREILGWVAEAACANARFDRNGLLEFVWFNPVNKTFDEHRYSEFTPAWYETKPIDSLHIRNADSTAELVLGEDDENPYMIQDNPFLRQPDSP